METPEKITIVLAIIAGFWEVIGRIIPTAGQITIVGKIIEILNWINNAFNNSPKKVRK